MNNQEFQEIRQQIVRQGIEGRMFDFDEPNTRRLFEEVKSWKKSDVHTHISASVSPSYFLERYRNFGRKYGTPDLLVMQQKVRQLANQINQQLAQDVESNIERLISHPPDKGYPDFYGERGDIADAIIKYNLTEFRDAVAHVAQQHFADNVVNLELRFFPSGIPNASVEEVVHAVNDGFEVAEKKYPCCNGRMIFTFNRLKKDMATRIYTYLSELYRIKQSDSALGKRMVGIDLCGFSDNAERTREVEDETMKYSKALQDAREHGFFLTCHLGEYCPDTPAEDDSSLLYLSIQTLQDCIEKIGFDRIGHAIVLNPMRAINLDPTGRMESKVREVIDTIKSKGKIIESCPLVYISSNIIKNHPDAQTYDWASFPIHEWVREGVNVHLGTDGLWTHPTSLSREAVKVLISNPYGLSLNVMKGIVGCSEVD